MKFNVMVSYDTYHSPRIREWLVKNVLAYSCMSIMDNSKVGMSFCYSFASPEDANAFKLVFG